MINSRTFFITKARANIFKIFKMVEEGTDVVIIKKDSNKRFKVSLIDQEPKKDIVKIAKEMSKIGLKAGNMTPGQMKKIFENRFKD